MQTINKKGKDAIDKVMEGICKVADPVESTMGPRGHNVVIGRDFQSPVTTNDGKSIAEGIYESEDKFISIGVEANKAVTKRTNDAVGDFTSTSSSLHKAIFKEGIARVLLGYNGTLIKKGMEQAVVDITEELKNLSKPITTPEEIKAVATLSSESEIYGAIIAETIEKVGKDGVVTVEESDTVFGVESEIVEGMEIDKGYIAPFMINDVARRETSLKNAFIFICDSEIDEDALGLLMIAVKKFTGKTKMVIVADSFQQKAMLLAFQNKLRTSFDVVLVNAPGYGENKKEVLEDLAVVCGTKVFSKNLGAEFTEGFITANLKNYLGSVDRITVGKDKTTIISDSNANKEAIEAQVKLLKEQADNIDAEFELERIQKRIARLAGGVAVIRVGAASDGELRQIKDKIDDAVASTKCAIEEGVVAGGGVGLLKAADATKKHDYTGKSEEFKMGYEIILKAVEAPIRAVLRNAKQEESVVLDKIRAAVDKDMFGFNADTLKYGDMIEMGIIEAVKGNRVALYNAYSEASTMLTADYYQVQEEKQRSE